MYDFDTESIVIQLKKDLKGNEEFIVDAFHDQIKRVEEMIDIQYKIARYFTGWWFSGIATQKRGMRTLNRLLFGAFHKNLITFFSAIKMNSLGLYGSARPLMRNIFEWLIISKFCSISEDHTVMEKWHNFETVYFSNTILKRIKIPSVKPFYDFWSIVCDYTHATRYSMQISVALESHENYKSIAANITVINALLECNYHLLNTHLITSECEYMGRFYYGSGRFPMPEYKVPELRKKAHALFKSNRPDFSKDLITLVATYKRKWQLSG